jgi:hypothetical protein
MVNVGFQVGGQIGLQSDALGGHGVVELQAPSMQKHALEARAGARPL